MKISKESIVILSDIHSNVAAFKNVIEDIERFGKEKFHFIFNGDVISLGPNPKECMEILNDFGQATFMLGNNDRYIIEKLFDSDVNFHNDKYDNVPVGLRENLRWTYNKLSDEDISFISTWEKKKILEFKDRKISISHGTPDSDEENIYDDFPEINFTSRFNKYDVYVFGHTHVPFVKKIGDKLYLNPGSIGSSLDGNIKASYAILNDKNGSLEVDIRRVDYDLSRTIDDMYRFNVPWRESIVSILKKGSF